MASYSDACHGSQNLCDLLFERLSSKIENLQRKEKKKSCTISQEGRRPFAYVYYKKTIEAIDVWCRGDVHSLKNYPGISFRERRKKGEGWEKSFPGRFSIDSREEIDAAVNCLAEEAYPRS